MDTAAYQPDYPYSEHRDVLQTTEISFESVRPADQGWFTRLISPLTSHQSSSSSSSLTSSTLASSSSSSAASVASPLLKSVNQPKEQIIGADQFDQYIPAGEVAYNPNIQNPLTMQEEYPDLPSTNQPRGQGEIRGASPVLLIFLPVLIVVLTVLIGLICFLVTVLLIRRRKGITLTEDGGPLDLSKGDGVIGEGGVEGVEARWLETVEPDVREGYRRAKEYQDHYPPSSVPTDITLSQFLSIQEKGVSAWSFEPDYEDNLSLYVQSRTEITFLSDGPGMPAREGGGNSVMANLPLPKLNEVYYWEVKIYDKVPSTEIAIGLATKPYPSFRMPGWNRHSVAYFASDGFKSHNYPFTASSYGQPLIEGDVLGVGYRPRTGTVFFTRNGRKMDDAYTGLQRLNLFPIVGANGPCTIHVNLGQAGFVFIEANVKKWGLAPMTGTLAPPPAYGSERGSILLDAGYGTPGAGIGGRNSLLEAARARYANQSAVSSGRSSNSSRRHRRAGRSANLSANLGGSVPGVPSPLRASEAGPGPTTAGSRRRVLGRASNESPMYVSPTDTPEPGPRPPSADAIENLVSDEEGSEYGSASEESAASSPRSHNPPTPNLLDISMHSIRRTNDHYFGGRQLREDEESGGESGGSSETARPPRPEVVFRQAGEGDSPPPPGYAPLDPNVYAGGLPADLPEEMVNQAIAAMSAAEQTQAQNESNGRESSGRIPWPSFVRRR